MIGRAAGMLAAAAFAAATLGAQQPARTTNDGVFTVEQARRGGDLYQERCGMCHGPTLSGMEMASPLAGAEFYASWGDAPLGDLFERIRVSMPQDNPGSLSRQQYADVIAFILRFNKSAAGQNELPGDPDVLKAIKIVSAP